MRLKDLFRRKDVVNLKDTTNLREKELIRKISRVGHIRLKLTARSKFKISENSVAIPATIAFELVDYPGHVMRSRNLELFGEKKRDDETFVNSSSFYKMPNLWFDGFMSFESTITAGHYIRLRGNDLILGRYDGSECFKEECSFKMTRNGFSLEEECSFKNEWITEESRVGLLVRQKKDTDHGKDSRVLLVPENTTKLPGYSPVATSRQKQPGIRKYSESSRSKKLVTFNKHDFVYENEPKNMRNDKESEVSYLNGGKEKEEVGKRGQEGSMSGSSSYKPMPNSKNLSWVRNAKTSNSYAGSHENTTNNRLGKRCRKKGEMRFVDDLIILKEEINEKDDKEEGNRFEKELNTVPNVLEFAQDDDCYEDCDDDVDCDDDNCQGRYKDTDKNDALKLRMAKSLQEQHSRNCGKVNELPMQLNNFTMSSSETQCHSDVNCMRFSDSNDFEGTAERHGGGRSSHCDIECNKARRSLRQQSIWVECKPTGTNKNLQFNNAISHEPLLHCDMERRQMRADDNEVAASRDDVYDSSSEFVLVCLPDTPKLYEHRETRMNKLKLPFDELVASERDRSDSGLPMSPCDGDLIMKRMNRLMKNE